MNHVERAVELFVEGYNCAQAVAAAFGDLTGLDEKTAARMASCFGGGMGRMREVCGAVSGALMVLGIAEGYSEPKDTAAKSIHYARVREFADRFKEKCTQGGQCGSIVCRDLLAGASLSNEAGGEEIGRAHV